MRNPRRLLGLVLVVIVALSAWWLQGAGNGGSAGTPSASTRQTPGSVATVAEANLPAEARHTLQLIDAGGPFPYDRDGVVFRNDERHLPIESTGYYHEYTVTTPGSADRGARRIIVGQDGSEYYTADHYNTFALIQRSG